MAGGSSDTAKLCLAEKSNLKLIRLKTDYKTITIQGMEIWFSSLVHCSSGMTIDSISWVLRLKPTRSHTTPSGAGSGPPTPSSTTRRREKSSTTWPTTPSSAYQTTVQNKNKDFSAATYGWFSLKWILSHPGWSLRLTNPTIIPADFAILKVLLDQSEH